MKRRILIEDVKKRLPSEVTLDESTYINSCVKARFVDKDFGEFWAQPRDVWKGHGHRKRGIAKLTKSKTTPLSEVISQLPNYIKIVSETYISLQEEAIFIDEKYGEFNARPKDVLKYRRHRRRSIENGVNVKLTASDIQARLPLHIKLVEDSFINTSTKCKFIDIEYGEFEATPHAILNVHVDHPTRSNIKRKKTCLEKYGVEHVSQDRNILLKMKIGARKTCGLIHWRTGEQLLCCGGYEKYIVEYLNQNKIDFQWQIPFTLSYGTYFCDLYLVESNTYVEIKGWWRQQISKDKWDEFHSKYSNSELWGYDKLKELGFKKRNSVG